jgi:hypothetical protein
MAFMQLTRSKFPDTPMWAENILDLQKQLVQARQVTERLCQDLETPSSSDRWIELGGEDPDIEKLKLRIVQLEARVNGAREELLEKDLILEEITSLAERLQAAASAATDTVAAASAGASLLRSPEAPGLTLAKSANELQGKIKDTNRKLMAVVSELSMYQATAIKLADETAAAQDALTKAEAALSRGLPPTVAAEQRWQFTERARSLTSSGVGTKLYVARRLWCLRNLSFLNLFFFFFRRDTAVVEGPKSSADTRPNAYIPEGIGLPKPYGEFPPFKPAEPGAIMRFFRNPEIPEIEL